MENQAAEIRTYFDAEAIQYFRGRENEYSFVSQKSLALEMLPRRARRILDAGCGPAVLAGDLLKRAREVWGIDVSEQMIAYGRARMEHHPLRHRCHLSVGDAQQMSHEEGFFDAVVSLGMLEYLISYRPALAEMYRVLRPGGCAVLSVPNRVSAYHLSRLAADKVRSLLKRALKRSPSGSERFVTNRCVPSRLDRELEAVGFRKLEARYCNFIFYPLHELHRGASMALNRRLSSLADRPLGSWLGTQYVVKVVKPSPRRF